MYRKTNNAMIKYFETKKGKFAIVCSDFDVPSSKMRMIGDISKISESQWRNVIDGERNLYGEMRYLDYEDNVLSYSTNESVKSLLKTLGIEQNGNNFLMPHFLIELL